MVSLFMLRNSSGNSTEIFHLISVTSLSIGIYVYRQNPRPDIKLKYTMCQRHNSADCKGDLSRIYMTLAKEMCSASFVAKVRRESRESKYSVLN